jgi:L-iditol 2-dehydrogenase
MQAVVRFGKEPGEVRLDAVPEPVPLPHEVKIEVKAAGVCGTDIQGHPAVQPPVVLGHELAGVVVEVGNRCTQRRVGERVTSETTKARCGACRYCRAGPVSLCVNRRGLSSSADGCFAKYVTLPEESTHVLPASVSFEAGALTEPLACATHAVIEQAGVGEGEVIVVLGPGPLGLLVARCSAVLGATVIVGGTSDDADRLALADEFEVDRTVDVTAENLGAVVGSFTDGYGADTVFECSGAEPAVHAGLACLRKRGRFVQAGILHRAVSLDFDDVFFVRELSLVGSHTSNPVSWVLALNLLAAGKVNLQPLITTVLPLAEWRRGFELMRTRQAIKVVLKP